jgi:tetratricopeptide (TPR) repeat protein
MSRDPIFRFTLLTIILLIAVRLLAQQAQPPQPAADQKAASEMSAYELQFQGDEFSFGKHYDKALESYRAAIVKEPQNPVLYNKAAVAEIQLRANAAAKDYLKQALQLDPQYPEAQNNLGVVAYIQKDYAQAVLEYKKAIALDPQVATFHSNLATAYFAQKKYDEAMAEFGHAVDLDPELMLRTSTGGTAAQIGEPQDKAYYAYMLARVYAKRGDVERCLHCLDDAKNAGYPKVNDAGKDPDFQEVRQDPRFDQTNIPH